MSSNDVTLFCSSCGVEYKAPDETSYYLCYKTPRVSFQLYFCNDCGTQLLISEPQLFVPNPDASRTACTYCRHCFLGVNNEPADTIPDGMSLGMRRVGQFQPVTMLEEPKQKDDQYKLFLSK